MSYDRCLFERRRAGWSGVTLVPCVIRTCSVGKTLLRLVCSCSVPIRVLLERRRIGWSGVTLVPYVIGRFVFF